MTGNWGTYCSLSSSTATSISISAAMMKTLFNFLGKVFKLFPLNFTWLACAWENFLAATLVTFGWLTHWGRVTHICISKLTSIGSDNGLSPGRRQAIIWTNTEILLVRPLGTNISEILIENHIFSFNKMLLKCRLRNGGHLVPASMC